MSSKGISGAVHPKDSKTINDYNFKARRWSNGGVPSSFDLAGHPAICRAGARHQLVVQSVSLELDLLHKCTRGEPVVQLVGLGAVTIPGMENFGQSRLQSNEDSRLESPPDDDAALVAPAHNLPHLDHATAIARPSTSPSLLQTFEQRRIASVARMALLLAELLVAASNYQPRFTFWSSAGKSSRKALD